MKQIFSLILTGALLLTGLTGCGRSGALDPRDPVTLTIWHVYGSQTESPMNDCIDEFNRTTGKENGVLVSVVSVSSSSAIDEALTAAAKGTPGVPDLPDLFTAYPRVAEIVGPDRLLDWSEYLDPQELDAFVDEFLEEGRFGGRLLMLPIAKYTEMLFLNKTLFDVFAAETGVTSDCFDTFEGLFDTCRGYYDWSGGQDLFQINDFYHYALTGMAARGEDFVTDGRLNLNSPAFEQVWLPMARAGIYGGLCLGDGYASDRWKTGEVLCNVGSTAGILYLRDYVTYPDNTTVDIETSILPYPLFEGGEAVVVHRGGGLFALKQEDERQNEAAALFARWLTARENNLSFVTKTGYLPVTEEAFAALLENVDTVEQPKYRQLYRAVDALTGEYTFCAVPVYEDASETQTAFEANVKAVLRAAREEYLARTAAGEEPAAALEELAASTVAQLRGL